MSLEGLARRGREALARLRASYSGPGPEGDGPGPLPLYHAGLRDGRVRFGLFGRDLLTTAILLEDLELLRATLLFCWATQGRREDPHTGEAPGRIVHEEEAVTLRGLSTRYNAADTTPLLLIAAERYLRLGGDASLIRAHGEAMRDALAHLLSRFRDGLYWEAPPQPAERYALRATYWKDSQLPGRQDPAYPICYTLVQAQAVCALRAAARMMRTRAVRSLGEGEEADRLERLAGEACQALRERLWDGARAYPLIALDGEGPIGGISSDGLHLLAYLEPQDLLERRAQIVAGAQALETPYGYRTYAPRQPDYGPESYHLGSIWPFDNAFIALGARRHGLPSVFARASRVLAALDELGFSELFGWDGHRLTALGCRPQLWSAAFPLALRRWSGGEGG